MVKQVDSKDDAELLAEIKRVRAAAVEHYQKALEIARERRRLIERFLAAGFSQADLARELGVTRQAIQKMIAAGQDQTRRWGLRGGHGEP
jgi:DNA-binding XRE family transcriptional regulator